MKKQNLKLFLLCMLAIPLFGKAQSMSNPVVIGGLGCSSSYAHTLNNAGYGNNFNSGNHVTGQASDDIWYQFTVSSNVQVTLSTCGSGFDTYLHLLNSSSTEIAYNDDDGAVHCGGYYYESYIQITLTPGTYYVVAEGYNTATGNIILNLNTGAPPGGGGCAVAATYNFVRVFTPRTEISDISTLQSLSTDKTQVETSTTYFDGLGREMQAVTRQGSASGKDLVVPIEYDQFGRQSKKYLPYASAGTDGEYKTEQQIPGSGVYSFYNPTGSGISGQQMTSGAAIGIPCIPTPAAQTSFIPSPLNQPEYQGAPGDDWQLNTGHATHVETSGNLAGEVKLWQINTAGNGAAWSNSYQSGTLYKTTLTDENGHFAVEFKNKQGQILCKKAQGTSTDLETNYIYDDFGNLAYVVPPIPNSQYPSSFAEADAVFINYIYGYHYDYRNRVSEKNIPGKGWQFMVYNTIDQLVMTQDANQRAKPQQEYTFTKYDNQGRMVMEGIWVSGYSSSVVVSPADNSSRISLENSYINTTEPKWEARDNNTATGYHNASTPASSALTFLNINYYDDYNYPNNPYGVWGNVPDYTSRPTGLATGSKRAVLNPNGTYGPLLWSVNWYDHKGRIAQSYKQHYFNTVNSTYNYDTNIFLYWFDNQVKSTWRRLFTYTNTGVAAVSVNNDYYYDHLGRKTENWQLMTAGSVPFPSNSVLLSHLDYNEVGQVMYKKLHSDISGTQPFLQSITYAYNERGWLRTANTDGNLFNFELKYNYGGNPQFNGNIAQMQYYAQHSSNKTFDYSYDPLNRLTNAVSTNNILDETVSYDNLGNITQLTRAGYGTLNYPIYTGNQVNTVTGFSPRTYNYDYNGNATSDGNANSKGISYNMLDLPGIVTQPGGTATLATYTYDANGNKLQNTGSDGTWDYIDGVTYKNNSLMFVQTSEGRSDWDGSVFKYKYDLKDHLGNVRVTFDKNPNTGIAETLQEDEYYAFGLRHPLFNNSGNLNNRYLYNGKEVQLDLTDQYDYGARFYDPVIARWTSIDPKAELDRRWSPYNYGSDDPIGRFDPDGNKDKPFNKKTDKPITPRPGTATPGFARNSHGNVIGALSSAKDCYNCHSYAWDKSKGDPQDPSNKNIVKVAPKWDNDPSNNIKEQHAKQLSATDANLPGDKAIYYVDKNKDGKYEEGEVIVHSAVVSKVDKDGNTTQVTGKMGEDAIADNHPDAPGYYKDDGEGHATSRAYFRVPIELPTPKMQQDNTKVVTPPVKQ
jgi:RHS repeat-associated protein